MRRGATALKWMVFALAILTTGTAEADSTSRFAQATAHLLDCDVPGGSVRFAPFGDHGVTMNLDRPATALADTPFAGARIVLSVSSPGKGASLQFGWWDSDLMASAETLLTSPGGVIRVYVNSDALLITGLVKGGGGREDGRKARLMCNSRKFKYENGIKVVDPQGVNDFAYRVMILLANDVRKNAEAISTAERTNSRPDGCWVRIGTVDRIGLRKNPDGSATFEMPDTRPTAGIVLRPDPNSDINALIGGATENIRALLLGGRTLQVQSANAILSGNCE